MFRSSFQGRRVLVTGHTGFKGSWLSTWLISLGAEVGGLSLDIPSTPSNYEACCVSDLIADNRIDVRDSVAVRETVLAFQPDFVFHLAAQALVRPSYDSPVETLEVNSIGTANVLDALRLLNKRVTAVMITSDKAYDNVEWVWGYRETDRLGGKDPYSASKGMAELVIRTYVNSFFGGPESNIRVGIARAGNVIGGGDWAVDRIVPDCMRAWSENKVVDIRSPGATRPWQHVLEPLSGYLSLASILDNSGKYNGEAYNYGPPANQNYPVSELIEEMSDYWDHVRWKDVSKSGKHLHEAGLLKLNCDKALFDLDWRPTMHFEETVRLTVEWYKEYYEGNGKSMYKFTLKQVCEYSKFARDRGIAWAVD